MDKILVIAKNTFIESVRDKILYTVFFIALALVCFSLFVGDWAVFNQSYVIQSMSLSMMSLSGLAIAVFVGIGLIQKEIQKKTVLTLIAKPVRRSEFILGKYLGLLGVIFVHVLLMSMVLLLVLEMSSWKYSLNILMGAWHVFLELSLMVSVAVLFSSFSTPVLSSLFTIGVYMAGHLSGELIKHLEFLKKSDQEANQVLAVVAKIAYFVFPNLASFNLNGFILHGEPVAVDLILYNHLIAFCWIALFLSLATWWFSRRDFV